MKKVKKSQLQEKEPQNVKAEVITRRRAYATLALKNLHKMNFVQSYSNFPQLTNRGFSVFIDIYRDLNIRLFLFFKLKFSKMTMCWPWPICTRMIHSHFPSWLAFFWSKIRGDRKSALNLNGPKIGSRMPNYYFGCHSQSHFI